MALVAVTGGGRAQPPAEDATDATRDILVYKDGDRLRGQLVRRTDQAIVFKSDRFGELLVRAADAVVIKAEKPAPAASAPEPGMPAEKAEEERVSVWNHFSPAVLTASVREFFGPWHGRAAVSSEVVTDTAEHKKLDLELKLSRKFKKDMVEISARYDFDQTNDVTTIDMAKGTGSWRHEFNKKQFMQYRPTAEWNRASVLRGLRSEYLLLQQEIGFGVHLWTTPVRKVRLGLSANLFDLWNFEPDADHTSRAVASTFEEIEFVLPWRMTLQQRGVWYPVESRRDGWENRIELSKNLTETLSVALRHEIRRNSPDGAALDYTRLKMLVGLDF